MEVDQLKTISVLQSLNLSNLNYDLDTPDAVGENQDIGHSSKLSSSASVDELMAEHQKQLQNINDN